jgi:hypothetical protein
MLLGRGRAKLFALAVAFEANTSATDSAVSGVVVRNYTTKSLPNLVNLRNNTHLIVMATCRWSGWRLVGGSRTAHHD